VRSSFGPAWPGFGRSQPAAVAGQPAVAACCWSLAGPTLAAAALCVPRRPLPSLRCCCYLCLFVAPTTAAHCRHVRWSVGITVHTCAPSMRWHMAMLAAVALLRAPCRRLVAAPPATRLNSRHAEMSRPLLSCSFVTLAIMTPWPFGRARSPPPVA